LNHPQRDGAVVPLAIENGDDTINLVRFVNELEFQTVEGMKGIVDPNFRYISIVLRFGSICLTLASD